MNDENLIPLNKRPKSEQRAIQVAGGKARGRQRRDKRDFRETVLALLELPMKSKDGEPIISPITGKEMSIRETLVTTALQGAIKGNVKQLQTILDILGERVSKVEGEVNVTHTRYENMTDEELKNEMKRLNDAIENT